MAVTRSHVPKFGDWDNDNLPYTAYFENARKEKAGIRMNPNDPEENPGAFMTMKGQNNQQYLDALCQHGYDKHHIDGQSRQNNALPGRNGTYNHQKSGRRRRSMASESGSEKSNSDHSVILRSDHQRANSGQKKGRAGGSSFSSSGNGHHRSASVPKFGDWDVTDPTSGEGFTVIFNKVREEKQTPSKLPTVPPQPSNYSPCHQSKPQSPSLCSKIFCCFF